MGTMRDAEEELRRAVIYRTQNFSTDMGPGTRTAIFFKGCPLACRWCERPEGISYRPELSYAALHCIVCGDCLEACPRGALSLTQGELRIHRRACDACGACVAICPTNALEVLGRTYSLPALLEIILQDKVFYEHSGGGVTFSGGEAASQQSLLGALAAACKSAQIHTVLDTCLIHEWSVYRALISTIDLWRVNLPRLDGKAGAPHAYPLNENLTFLKSARAHIWIQTLIVPGWSDDEANIQTLARTINRHAPAVERWELRAFSPARGAYQAQGQVFEEAPPPLLESSRLRELARLARAECDRRIPVIMTGPTVPT